MPPLSIPTTGVLLDFAGAAVTPVPGTTNAIKSGDGNVQTSGGGLGQLNSGSNATAWYSTSSFNADQEAFMTVTTLPGSGNPIEIYLRLANPGTASVNGYRISWNIAAGTDTWDIARIDAGVATNLLTGISQDGAANDTMYGYCLGTEIGMAYQPSGGPVVRLASVTDSTYTSGGYIGFGLWFSTVRVDNFGGGNMVPPTSSVGWWTA